MVALELFKRNSIHISDRIAKLSDLRDLIDQLGSSPPRGAKGVGGGGDNAIRSKKKTNIEVEEVILVQPCANVVRTTIPSVVYARSKANYGEHLNKGEGGRGEEGGYYYHLVLSQFVEGFEIRLFFPLFFGQLEVRLSLRAMDQ